MYPCYPQHDGTRMGPAFIQCGAELFDGGIGTTIGYVGASQEIEVTADAMSTPDAACTLPDGSPTAGKKYAITIQAGMSGGGPPAQVEIIQDDGNGDQVLAQSTISLQEAVTMDVTSVGTADPRIRVTSGDVGATIRIQLVTYKEIDEVQEDVVVMECNDDEFDDDYRFGFNGQVKDNNLKGIGNLLDFGARIHDSRLGRFLSLDPLAKNFPSESNYSFSGNSPLAFVDMNGKVKFSAHMLSVLNKYPIAYDYFTKTDMNSIGNLLDLVKDDRVVNALINNTAYANLDKMDRIPEVRNFNNPIYKLTKAYIQKAFTFGDGPEIVLNDAPGGMPMANGYNHSDDGTLNPGKIELNIAMFETLNNAKTEEEQQAALMDILSVFINEFMEDFAEDQMYEKDASGNQVGEAFGNQPAQDEIFGNPHPAPGPVESGNAKETIRKKTEGTLTEPAFIPTLPKKTKESEGQ